MQISTIGLDIAKDVFQVHGIDAAEKVVVRKQLRRSQVLAFFKALPSRAIVWSGRTPPIASAMSHTRSAYACFEDWVREGPRAFLPVTEHTWRGTSDVW